MCSASQVVELPFQTFERILKSPWPGGKTPMVTNLLKIHGVPNRPGSSEANLNLQRCLNAAVAYRVKDFGDGWILFHSILQALREARGNDNLIQPLYTNDTHWFRLDGGA